MAMTQSFNALNPALLIRTTPTAPQEVELGRLHAIAACLQTGELARAQQLLSDLPDVDPASSPAALKASLFRAALARRIPGADRSGQHGNLYTTEFVESQGQQINLFNIMGTQMPLVTRSTWLANAILLELMRGHELVTLLDVGIGTGRQELDLLRALHAEGAAPKHLEIIGVEPGDAALDCAAVAILAEAKALGLSVSFVAHPGLIEDFTRAQWESLRRPGRLLLINEGFAIHHLHYGDRPGSDARVSGDAKQDTLNHLRSLQPAAIVLAEPDSDHSSADLVERLENAWRHYGQAFEVIDATGMALEVKAALKGFFFGRELIDVLGTDDATRSERHETAAMWTARLLDSGFGAAPMLPPFHLNDPLVTLCTDAPGRYSLRHNDVTVVSLIVRSAS